MEIVFNAPPVLAFEPPSVLAFLKPWMDIARGALTPIQREAFKQDIQLIRGKGKYMRLLNHKKKRVAKKYMRRLRKGNLPGVSLNILKGGYPLSMDMESSGCHTLNGTISMSFDEVQN